MSLTTARNFKLSKLTFTMVVVKGKTLILGLVTTVILVVALTLGYHLSRSSSFSGSGSLPKS